MSEILPSLAEIKENDLRNIGILSGEKKKTDVINYPFKNGKIRTILILELLNEIDKKTLTASTVKKLTKTIKFYERLADIRNDTLENLNILSGEEKKTDVINHPFKNGKIRTILILEFLKTLKIQFLTPEEQKTYHATVLFYKNLLGTQKQEQKLLENKEKVDIEKMNTDLAVFFTTKKRVFAEAERRTVKIGLEQLEDQYKIIDSLDYSEEIKKEYKKYLGVHIADYKEFLKTPEDKDVYTSVVQIKTALENKTFFTQKTTTDGVVYYPVVKINLQKEKYGVVPKPVIKLINTQKKELAEKNFITKVFIVEKKEKISNAKAKKNRDAIDKDFYAYFEKTSSIDYVGSRFQIDSESTSSEFKANIKNGKIGKYFRGKKGVHCALYVEKYLSPKVGIIVAGDAWTKISNLQAGGALEIIAQRDDLQHLEKRELGAIRKENYNRKYTDSLLQNYEIIKKRFEKKSGLPMILGVHFLHTGTDRTKAQGGNGLLLNARDLYRKNSPKVKHRPAPNSHIFAMEHSYVRTINGNGRSLENVLVRLWRINRHSAEGKASLDIHSAIIGDLKISIDGGQTYKKISSLPSGLNTILNGKIKFKGIGISDEIGGNVKKEFFALRMATHQNGKAMYSFVQAGQITTKTLREREKKYDTVMKGLDVEFVPLNTLGINSIISQNLIPKIKLYSKEFYEVRALYAQFFNINTVLTTTKIPVFKNREDLKKALNRFDYGLSVGENKEKVGTASQFIQIGNADGTSAKSTKELMQYFLKKIKLSPAEFDISNPHIQKVFLYFLLNLAQNNSGSYFNEIMKDVKKESTIDIENSNILMQFFTMSSKIYYEESDFPNLILALKKAKIESDKEKITEMKDVFSKIPFDFIREKLNFPLSIHQLKIITKGDAYEMRSLIYIWIKETAWGKKELQKLKGKDTDFIDAVFTNIKNKADSLYSFISNTSSAGDWQVKIQKIENENNDTEEEKENHNIQNAQIIFEKTKNFITDFKSLLQQDKSIIVKYNNQETWMNKVTGIEGSFDSNWKMVQEIYNKLELSISKKDEDGNPIEFKKGFNDIAETLRSRLVIFYEMFPEAGAVMAHLHVVGAKKLAYKHLENVKKKDEKITKKNLSDMVIEAHSSPIVAAQSPIVNVLEKLMYRFEDSAEMKIAKNNIIREEAVLRQADLFEKGEGAKRVIKTGDLNNFNTIKVAASEKGKIRIIQMTFGILKYLSANKTGDFYKKLQKQIELDPNADGKSIDEILEEVRKEIEKSKNNSDSKALMLSEEEMTNGNLKSDTYPYFKIFFQALRETDSSLSVDVNVGISNQKKRKSLFNTVASTENVVKKIEHKGKIVSKYLEKEEHINDLQLENQNIDLTILRLENFIKDKDEDFELFLQGSKKAENNAIKIQKLLQNFGLYSGKIDGEFGKASYEALNKIDAIFRPRYETLKNSKGVVYKRQAPLQKKDILAIIKYFKNKETNNTKILNGLTTSSYKHLQLTNNLPVVQDIDTMYKLKQKLNDTFLSTYKNRKIAAGVLKGLAYQIVQSEKLGNVDAEKIKNLKTRVAQLSFTLLSLYKGKIDGAFGKNTKKSFAQFLEKFPKSTENNPDTQKDFLFIVETANLEIAKERL